MGALYRSTCYASTPEALAATCSEFGGSSNVSNTLYTWQCTGVSGTNFVVSRWQNGTPQSPVFVSVPTLQDCDYSVGSTVFLDFLYLALPIVATVWGLRRLYLIFSTHHERD